MKTLLAAVLFLSVPIAMAVPGWAAEPAANGDLTDAPCTYPAAALTRNAQGATLMSYTGSARGTVEEVKLLSSSGHADLDTAAMACVAHWRFNPKSSLGARLVGTNRLNIAWKIGAEPGATPAGKRAAIPHLCHQDYPPAAMAAQASGTTSLAFVISIEGQVKDATVLKSSGNADLDAASLECVRFWRYRPALKSGQPVEVPWKADIKWELYDPPVPEE